MDSPHNVYKLKDGKKPKGWQLPLSEVLIAKEKKGIKSLKKIKYVPGTDSFFAEDLAGDLKPVDIWFNDGQLVVPKVDKLTNDLLQMHPWYNKFYELYNPEIEAGRELESLKVKGDARRLIEESDSEKLKAIALALFGVNAFNWGESKCELELLKYADQKPTQLQAELRSKDYESKYLAALAFSKQIVATNPTKTTVIWNDTTKGVILRLAKGESGIHKLGELLSTRTQESELILQEIGLRIEKLDIKLPKVDPKDAEIAALKAKLVAAEKISKTDEKLSLKVATEKYVSKFGKVPNNKKNDLDWILSKIK